ncbi:transposase [Corynebacterium sp. CCM 9204]|uniref:transposase n=1 Tax=Corynebacterium sp. CCM 9204 TaxID=3057616 RepID=UPI003526BAC9
MRRRVKKDPFKLVDAIFDGLKAQTITVPATTATEMMIPQLATNIKVPLEQRTTIAKQVEELLEDFPLSEVLMSTPGVGVKTATNILLAIGDFSDCRSAGHLAAYAAIAPVNRRSDT